jgi:hypothetical protein
MNLIARCRRPNSPRISRLQIPQPRPRKIRRFAQQPQHLGGIVNEVLAVLLGDAQHQHFLPGDPLLTLHDVAAFHAIASLGDQLFMRSRRADRLKVSERARRIKSAFAQRFGPSARRPLASPGPPGREPGAKAVSRMRTPGYVPVFWLTVISIQSDGTTA